MFIKNRKNNFNFLQLKMNRPNPILKNYIQYQNLRLLTKDFIDY